MRFYISLLMIFLLSINAKAQQSLTLDDAVKIALQKNTTLAKNVVSLKSNESNLKAAYGQLLPSLGASGSWRWDRSEGPGGTFVQGGTLVFRSGNQESRAYTAGAQTQWTLFDGLANFATISQRENDLEAARLSLERVKQDIVFNTIADYYLVLNAKQVLKVREDDLAYNKKNLEIFTERNQLGAVTLADVYAQQVNVGNSELALIQAKNDLDTYQSQLMTYLGLDVMSEINISDPIETDTTRVLEGEQFLNQYSNIRAAVEDALNNRLDYKSAQYRLESANNGITIAKGYYYPQLSNNNSFGSTAGSMSELFKSRGYSVGLTLSLPIFSGWATENNVEYSKVQAKTREIELTELERQIKIDLKKTYLDYQAAQKRLEVSAKNVLSAQQNRQIEQEKYNIGSGTFVNLLLASSNYTLALQTNINNRFDFYRLKSQLEYYLGILDYKKFE
ncbi:MAG TPA: TolC family protein [Ignavibacteriales bacterium]|nr:TolC family protein [Ignavibacteriales bacterium]